MAFISASGIAFAGPTAASARSTYRGLAAFALLALAAPAPAQANDLEVQVQGLRNARGLVRLCLTRNREYFPDCNRDPAAVKRSVPANQAASIRLAGVAPGVWALAVMHDENGNGRLDRFLAIPREGFGFSRNPRIRMGPPRFDEVRFDFAGAALRQTVRIRYLL
jgi:uncharacterized protein (DUF2141 family)